MNNEKEIEEINTHISDALSQWSEIMLHADADNWAYNLNYSDEDLLNAFFIFNHVATNIAIKNGALTGENAVSKMYRLRDAIKNCYGFDTVELTNKVLYNETTT
jgi:hypothetical protein